MNTFRVLLLAAGTAAFASACSSGGSNAAPPDPASNGGVKYTSAFDAHMEGSNIAIHVMPPANSPIYAGRAQARTVAPQSIGSIISATPTPTPVPTATPTPNPLTYHSGPIQTHPVVYTVWYGAGWNDPTKDPGGEKPFLKNFYKAVGNSKWLNDVRQYAQTDGAAPDNEAPLLTGSWVDATSPQTTTPDFFDMYAEALAAAAHFGDYSINANYVILTPQGITPVGFRSQYCGYHSAAYVAAQDKFVSYTVLPYLSDNNSIISCDNYVFNHATDAAAIVAGHELAEAITDPLTIGKLTDGYFGWVDTSQVDQYNRTIFNEIGDKCAWQNLEINATIGDGLTYPSQPLFNNGNLLCRQEPNKQY